MELGTLDTLSTLCIYTVRMIGLFYSNIKTVSPSSYSYSTFLKNNDLANKNNKTFLNISIAIWVPTPGHLIVV